MITADDVKKLRGGTQITAEDVKKIKATGTLSQPQRTSGGRDNVGGRGQGVIPQAPQKPTIGSAVNNFIVGANPIAPLMGAMEDTGALISRNAQRQMDEMANYESNMQAYNAQIKKGIKPNYPPPIPPSTGGMNNIINPILARISQNRSELTSDMEAKKQNAAQQFKQSVPGYAGDLLLTGGEMLGAAATAATGGVPFVGLLGYESGTQVGKRALDEGYAPNKAMTLGIGAGAITAGVESLFGIAGKAGAPLVAKVAKSKLWSAVASKVSPKVLESFAKWAGTKGGRITLGLIGDALGEGAEEGIEYDAQRVFENFMLDKDVERDVKQQLYSVMLGAGVGGLFGGGRALGIAAEPRQIPQNPTAQSLPPQISNIPQNTVNIPNAAEMQNTQDLAPPVTNEPIQDVVPVEIKEQLRAYAKENMPDATDAEIEQAINAVESSVQNQEIADNISELLPASDIFSVETQNIKVAPNLYQFKGDTDGSGTTKLLKNVEVFDKNKAGVILVHQRNNGELYVVNGHHRLELANRLNVPLLDVRVVRESDGVTVSKARQMGALMNIAEGRGTPLDADKIFREGKLSADELKQQGVSLTESLVEKGYGLSKLNSDVHSAVLNDMLSEEHGAMIGNAFENDSTRQSIAYKTVKRIENSGKNINAKMVQQAINITRAAEIGEGADEQFNLFGSDEATSGDTKMDIVAKVTQELERIRRTFAPLTSKDKTQRISKAGNKLNDRKNERIYKNVSENLEAVEKLAYYIDTDVGALLDDYANSVFIGEMTEAEAVNELVKEFGEVNYAGNQYGKSRENGARNTQTARTAPKSNARGETSRISEIGNKAIAEELKAFADENNINVTEEDIENIMFSISALADTAFLDRVSSKFGVEFDVQDIGVQDAEAFISGNKIILSPTATQESVVRGVVLHELTHYAETSQSYGELKTFAVEQMPDFAQQAQAKMAQYKERGVSLSQNQAEAEVVAEYVRNTLFADPKAIEKLVAQKPTVARQLYDAIVQMIEKLKSVVTGQQLSELEQGRRLFEKALNTSQVTESDGKFSITPSDKAKIAAEYKRLLEEYGAIKQGENPARNIPVPQQTSENKRVRQGARTFAESEHFTDDMKPGFEKMIVNEALSYSPIKDDAAASYADGVIVGRGYQGALSAWDAVANGTARATKNQIVLGERLFIEAANRGDTQKALDLLAQIAVEGTNAGQTVQAFRVLKRLGKEGRILAVMQSVNKMNRTTEEKRNKKMTPEERQEVNNLKQQEQKLKAEVDEAQAANDEAKGVLSGARAERSKLAKRIEDRKNSTMKTEEKILDKVTEILDFNIVLESVQKAYDDAKGVLDAARAERNSIKEQIKSLKGRTVTAIERTADIEEKLPLLQKQLAEMQDAYEEALADFEVTRDIYNSAKAELKSIEGKTDTLKRREYSHWWNAMQINEKIETAKREYDITKRKYDDTHEKRKAIQKIKTKISQISGELFIPQANLEEIMAVKDGDTEALDDAINRAYVEIAKQMPATWLDKWNSWRYLAMLGNPRTHVRNIVGNSIFYPARQLKNLIKAGAQNIPAYKGEKTSAILTAKDKPLKQFARQSWEEVKDDVTSGGKMNPSDIIRDHRTIFKTKLLEGARKLNFAALEAEDAWFLRNAYVSSMAQYLKANNIDVRALQSDSPLAKATVEKAVNYATEEALKATYRDANSLSTALNNLSKNKVAHAFVEGIVPFKKTPLNIIRRGIEYSPAGLVNGVLKMAKAVRNGMDATEALDDMCAGLSGTAILLLGQWLYSMGWLVGAGDEDKKKRDFEKMQGKQFYSLQIGDSSYTIDWAAPISLPLFVGAEIERMRQKEEGFTFTQGVEALSTILEPMVNLSMLNGVDSAIQSAAYGEFSPLTDIGFGALTSYVSQANPTLAGQIARTIDPTRRNAYYTDKTVDAPKAVQQMVDRNIAKIPFATKTLPRKIDAWGREDKGDALLERTFENFISPGYLAKKNVTPVDEEVKRLYDATGEPVLPNVPSKYFTLDKERIDVSKKDYELMAEADGRKAFELIDQVIKTKDYDSLDDAAKARVIQDIYSISSAVGKNKIEPDYGYEKWMNQAMNPPKGVTTAEWLVLYDKHGSRLLSPKIEDAAKTIGVKSYLKYSDELGSGATQEEAQDYLDGLKIPKEDKAVMWYLINTGWKTNPYGQVPQGLSKSPLPKRAFPQLTIK